MREQKNMSIRRQKTNRDSSETVVIVVVIIAHDSQNPHGRNLGVKIQEISDSISNKLRQR